MKKIDLMLGKIIRYFLSILGIVIFYSCAINTEQSFYDFEPLLPEQSPRIKEPKDYQIFFNVIQLGYDAVNAESFQSVVANLPGKDKNNPIVIVKVDELPLGVKLGPLAEKDLALENGLYKGLLNQGYSVIEKLDNISIRNPEEFIDTTPLQGFYMHPIDINAHKIIQETYGTNLLLEYQIIHLDTRKEYLMVYFRLVDIEKMKILGSNLVEIDNNGESQNRDDAYEKKFNQGFQLFNEDDFNASVQKNLSSTAIIDLDILNIGGVYSSSPSLELMALENGIISGLINNNSSYKAKPYIHEKTEGFYLKYPEIYTNIVFNTNPILYEEWSELISKTGCTEILFYRQIKDEGVYVRIVDAELNGEILFSKMLQFKNTKDIGIIHNHNFISDNVLDNFDFEMLSGKSIMIIDGDKHPLQPREYIENRKKFNEMHMAIEEGFISALVEKSIENGFSVKEKLKTLYLKQPWMYDKKVFYLNPLYLDNWKQLKEYGADMILLYNNLISYENIGSYMKDYKKVAISYRWIDVNSGQVSAVQELTNDY